MRTTEYRTLRKVLIDEGAFRISDARGLLTVLAEFTIFGAGHAYLGGVATPFGARYWIVQVLLGSSLYRMFVILHECGHKTLFRSQGVNTFVGTLVSLFCLMPYFPWRNIHFLHHKWVGVIDKDPTQAHLLRLRGLSEAKKTLFRIFWKCYLPIPYIMFIFNVFWGYPFRQFRQGDRDGAWKGGLSVLVCLAPHVTLLACLGPGRYFTQLGPMLLVYYVIFELVNLPQHGGIFPHLSDRHPESIPPWEQDAITRSAWMPRLLGAVFCYNFNLHTEHHLFPTVPWYALPKVTRRIADTLTCIYNRVDMVGYTIASRLRDPIDIYVRSLPDPGEGAAGFRAEPAPVACADVAAGAGSHQVGFVAPDDNFADRDIPGGAPSAPKVQRRPKEERA